MIEWSAILTVAAAERQALLSAIADPLAAQLALLQRLIERNADTAFGRAHRFNQIDSLATYRQNVPVRTYEAFRRWINRACNGEGAVLTQEPVVAFEETGGSTSGPKLIPLTRLHLGSFRAAVLPWLADLAGSRVGAFKGRAYVAVSPAVRRKRTTVGGVPIGLSSEGAYLGEDLVEHFASILVTPPSIFEESDVDRWRFATHLHLLAAADLTFVSVWSPIFLTSLIESLTQFAEPLAKAIFEGSDPSENSPSSCGTVPPDPERARLVTLALSASPVDTHLLWPRLDTISCWADGPSRPYANVLRDMFPSVYVQPKGLLATECAVSLPWVGSRFPIPALNSTLLEFADDEGGSHLCNDLESGETYRIIISTLGGLYRYDLGDQVLCHSQHGELPRLEFVGRAELTSDLVGEKLGEDFVARVLRRAKSPACLAPRPTATPYYELLIDTATEDRLQALAESVDRWLAANPQYAYARRLGQLGPVKPRAIKNLTRRYLDIEVKRGRRLGLIKPPVLILDSRIYLELMAKEECVFEPVTIPLTAKPLARENSDEAIT